MEEMKAITVKAIEIRVEGRYTICISLYRGSDLIGSFIVDRPDNMQVITEGLEYAPTRLRIKKHVHIKEEDKNIDNNSKSL